MQDTRRTRPPRLRAFTLVELLVVIVVIAVLLALLMPALSKARYQALNLTCMSNLRVDGQALINYAAVNQARLPMHLGMAQGHWLWDLPVPTRDEMLRYGASRKTMYCPFAPDEDGDAHWTFGNPPVCVTGYFWLITRANGPLQMVVNGVHVGVPFRFYSFYEVKKGWVTVLGERRPAEREVGIDAVMQDPNTGKFGGIQGGWIVPHNTSHMDRYGHPMGGNILYLDGHVAWRNFRDMLPRYQGQDGPLFYF